jgi:hypothetical protein
MSTPASPNELVAHRLLMAGIGFQLGLFLPAVFALGLDERMVRDVATWAKPIKFHLSLTLLMATVALALPLMSRGWRVSRLVVWSVMALVIASTLDTAYFTLQGARGRASHFNADTLFEDVMYETTGIAAVVILIGCFIAGFAVWRSPRIAGFTGTQVGMALGLMIGAVLTLVTAGFMAADVITESGRWANGVRSDAQGLPIVGWSMTGGDLRVSHFFATHLMQALPLIGLAADRLAPRLAGRGLAVGTLLGVLLVAWTFAQALAGRPFIGA